MEKNVPQLDKADSKLLKHLVEWGVTEEEGLEFIGELKEEVDEEPKIEEAPEQPVEPSVEPEGEEPKEMEEPIGEEAPVEQVEEEAEVPEAVAEPIEEEQPQEVPPMEEAPIEEPKPEEPVPQVDYQAKYEELQKAIDGIATRFESLEEALEKVGVLMPKESPVGVPNQEPETGNNLESSNDEYLKLLNR